MDERTCRSNMPLIEIHIHIPAEHLVDGSEHYPMEMQVASRHPIKSRVLSNIM